MLQHIARGTDDVRSLNSKLSFCCSCLRSILNKLSTSIFLLRSIKFSTLNFKVHVPWILLLIVILSVGCGWLSAKTNKHLRLLLTSSLAVDTDQLFFVLWVYMCMYTVLCSKLQLLCWNTSLLIENQIFLYYFLRISLSPKFFQLLRKPCMNKFPHLRQVTVTQYLNSLFSSDAIDVETSLRLENF